jgi:UDP-N-acetylglucosamine:LPS N-acetylglucosamine transferase
MADAPGPLLVAINMGYGHLRPAHALAERLGVPVLEVDRPPLAAPVEQRLWARTRHFYEGLTRFSQLPAAGPLRGLVGAITDIPELHPYRDLSAATAGVRLLRWLSERRGLGRGTVEAMRASGRPLLTTFFAPAVIADHLGEGEVYCVVTDADINRVWAPFEPARTRIHYLVPSTRAARRLRAYGVPGARIELTGFPLPHELLGGPELPALRENLAARLVRLDPEGVFRRATREAIAQHLPPLPADQEGRAPLVTFAVGGAGAQANLVPVFLPGMAAALREGRLRLALVAGVRGELADAFERTVEQAGLEPGRHVEILFEPEHAGYFHRFNELLARTDVLWTKPSEITFFAALGLGMVFSWPVGTHERFNRRWAIDAGAGIRQRDPRWAAEWLAEDLADGTLAAAAWSGFMRLPKHGLYKIVDAVARAR